MNQNSPGKWSQKMDPDEHIRTYDGFIVFTKAGTVAIGVILVLMAVFLL